MEPGLIAYSIPVFFLLIGLELVIDRSKKSGLYRFNDAITNISCGIGSQLTGVFIKTLSFIAYLFIWEKFRIFSEIPNTIPVWIILFIGIDFFYYWFHRLAHEISLFWGSHIVHHQSEEYNFSVALRQGWLQGAFSMWFYLPLALIGFDPFLFVSINALQTLYQFWIHTKTIDRMPAWFEYIFNTPSHHRVHHGVQPKYIDKNHGGTLIIFDRMFGTFQAEEEEVVYGITNHANSWNPVRVNFEYWIDLFRKIFKARNLKDGLKILFGPPGWKPDYMGGLSVATDVSSRNFEKYDTKVPVSLNYYVFFQYLIVLGGTSFFLFSLDKFDILGKVVASLFIIWSIVNLGAIFESRKWVIVSEFLRLVTIAIGSGWWAMNSLQQPWPVLVSGLLLLIVSLVWLLPKRAIFTAPISPLRNDAA